MRFRVTLPGRTPVEIKPGVSDLVKFERTYDMPAEALDEEGRRVEWLTFVAFCACIRKGAWDGDFDSFMLAIDEDVADFEMVPEDETADLEDAGSDVAGEDQA